jgi:hypothetical protein
VRPQQNPLRSARTMELCFIHEFAANCYEFLRNGAFDKPIKVLLVNINEELN